MEMTRELLDILIKYNTDILNLNRIKKDLKQFQSYALMLENLILNRGNLYGVGSEQVENWNENCMPIIKLVKPYYVQNNPYYK